LIERVSLIGSTNAALLARIAAGEGAREGHWLVADRQDQGRGRQGRAWFDGLGNFMGSTIVEIKPGDPPAHTLALLVGLSLVEVVGPMIPPPTRPMLKWPNDVLVNGAKLAGILLERSGDNVVIGIGVNLAVAPELPDRATLALSSFMPAPDRDTFAGQLADAFAQDLERWRTYGLLPVIARWIAAAHPLGTALATGEPDEPPVFGTFAGLDDGGALLLLLPDGTKRAIHAGEIRLADEN
jgi:BirA family biotin operon repressor/biotin-[acetyl-CoA-carboxylase] ligase